MTAAAAETQSHSPWRPLRYPAFRGLWTSSGVYFVGNAMQSMAASWLMVEITGSSFLAALVQTAVFLPMFLLSLLVLFGLAGPATLLFFTFAAGCCTALFSPSWNSTVIDAVPREDLPQAITAMSMAWNAARALGPALAGVVFAQLGAGWVFAIAVTSVLMMMRAINKWPPPPHPQSRVACSAACALRVIRRLCWPNCCARWLTVARARRCGPCCR